MRTIKVVEEFWNDHPCGASPYLSGGDKRQSFCDIERERYLTQEKIPEYASFGAYKGKRVLEVGCGIGTDGIQFARAGAVYTGVDVTDAAVNIAKERFRLFNQTGEFYKLNAEKLSFPDNTFDHVYSFGVIHHSCSPERIVDEIYRVLKPGGTITVMLYNRTSFYYLIEVVILRKAFFLICDKERLCKAIFSLFGKSRKKRFESFREKYARYKETRGFPSGEAWVSMNTDDVFCPIARVYSAGESKKLFSRFNNFRTSAWFIDKENWLLWLVFSRFISGSFERFLEKRFGWFRMILAEKPLR